MYGLPGLPIQFGAKLPAKKRGRIACRPSSKLQKNTNFPRYTRVGFLICGGVLLQISPVYRIVGNSRRNIDTVRLRSPTIDESLACFLHQQMILKTGADLSIGEQLYSLTSGQCPPVLPSFVQESFKVTVRLKIGVPGVESMRSAMK